MVNIFSSLCAHHMLGEMHVDYFEHVPIRFTWYADPLWSSCCTLWLYPFVPSVCCVFLQMDDCILNNKKFSKILKNQKMLKTRPLIDFFRFSSRFSLFSLSLVPVIILFGKEIELDSNLAHGNHILWLTTWPCIFFAGLSIGFSFPVPFLSLLDCLLQSHFNSLFVD